jgi:hypothetical protein
MNATIDESATAAGRSPQDIRRLYNIDANDQPAEVWAEQLAGLALDHGVSDFIVTAQLGGRSALARYAEEVAPAVRALVGAERGGRPAPAALPPPAGEPSAPAADPDWDESTRPTLPPEDHPSYGDGTALVEIHDHLRSELAQVVDLVGQVADGALDVAAARSAVSRLTIRQNAWSVGAYCASYCRVVTVHHTIEDGRMFPGLREQDERLGPVLDRLAAEHQVIHAQLEAVDRALVALVTDPTALTPLTLALDRLSDRLRSHLRYEEEQLVGPLNRYGIGI